jgi:uncharacterized phage-associated protein
MLGFNYKKSVQALNYFATKSGGTINKMSALKLIWLSDRLHLRKYCRPILNDTYFALNYGPVASHTKDLIEGTSFLSEEESKYREQFIAIADKYYYKSIGAIDKKVFSASDLQVMDDVYSVFGNFNQFELSEESHKYPEWKRFESHLKSKSSSRFEMNYEDFFLDSDQIENSIFKLDHTSLELAKDLFIENGYIYRLI